MTSETDNAQLEQQQPPTTDNNSDDVVSIDLPAPTGWLKKFTPKKGGTPRRNEIVFIAPTGEEIKNKNQLRKYLKSHSGGPALSEFDWSTGDTPRRSSRLRNKPEVTETPESGPSRKKQKSSKVEAEEEETANGESDENDASADKTEVEKDVEMRDVEEAPVEKTADEEKAPVEETADEEKAPVEKIADEEKVPIEKTADEKAPVEKTTYEVEAPAEKTADEVGAPVEKTADEGGVDTIEKADETDLQGQVSNLAGLSDEKQIQPEDTKPEGTVEQGNAPVPEEFAGQGNTQLPKETAAPAKLKEQPAEYKVESVTEQVEPQMSLETVIQPEDIMAEAGVNHFNVALPENKNAVDVQSAGNNGGPEKELARDQPEAYNLTINDYAGVYEAAPTHSGIDNFETNNAQEDLEKVRSDEVGTDYNNSTKENQEALKHTENNSVIADNTTHESSGAPPISC